MIVEATEYGSCTWSIDDDGVLEIYPTSGTEGTLDDWGTSYSASPWYSYRTQITAVSISADNGTVYAQRLYGAFYEMTACTEMDLSGLDTSATTTMAYMFYNCSALTELDVSGFDTSAVTNISHMFRSCSGLTELDLSNFDTSAVTNMSYMFYGCTGLTALDVSGFDTSAVTNMARMFHTCWGLTTLDLSGFDTSAVTDMSYMFYGCSCLTALDLSGFDTSAVTTMYYMFYACYKLTALDLSNFDTSAVTNFSYMFRGCTGLITLNLSYFDTRSATTLTYMFYNCTSLTTIYATDWSSYWDSPTTTYMFTDCTALEGAISYSSSYVTGTYANPDTGYFTNNCNESGSCYWIIDCASCLRVWPQDNSSGTLGTWSSSSGVPWYSRCTEVLSVKILDTRGTVYARTLGYAFYGMTACTEMDLSGLDTSAVTLMYYMFCNCTGLTTLDLSGFDTSAVTYMDYMFFNCSALTTIKLSTWDTSAVTHFAYTFANCDGLTALDVSGFDTSAATTMSYMFSGCSSLTELDVSGFDTSAVTTMSYMFSSCSGLTELDVSGFDTSAVTTMSYMFGGCSGLTELDVSGFDTSAVTKMSYMFFRCSGLTELDLLNFDVSAVTTFQEMFYKCNALVTIYATEWTDEAVAATNSTNMFYGCTALVGAIEYSSDCVTIEYANTTTGYFTSESAKRYLCGSCYWRIDANGLLSVWPVDEVSGVLEEWETPPWYSRASEVTGIYIPAEYTVQALTAAYIFADFENCTGSVTLGGLDTQAVSSFAYAFNNYGAAAVKTKYISTKAATDFTGMFEGSSVQVLDVSLFVTRNVTSFASMFKNCTELEEIEGLDNWNTKSAKSFSYMFYKCTALETLDLSSFNVTAATNFSYMFYGCTSLTTIYATEWTDEATAATSSTYMFTSCSALVGAISYSSSKVTITYANTTTGYFTAASEIDTTQDLLESGVCYLSNNGDIVNLDGDVFWLQNPEVFNRVDWSYESYDSAYGGGTVRKFSKGLRDSDEIELNVIADTMEEYSEIIKDAQAVFESDIRANTPGRLYVNGWWIYCYIRAQDYSDFYENMSTASMTLTALYTAAYWSNTHEIENSDLLLYRYTASDTDDLEDLVCADTSLEGTVYQANINNAMPYALPVCLTFEAPFDNPWVLIGENFYAVHLALDVGSVTYDTGTQTITVARPDEYVPGEWEYADADSFIGILGEGDTPYARIVITDEAGGSYVTDPWVWHKELSGTLTEAYCGSGGRTYSKFGFYVFLTAGGETDVIYKTVSYSSYYAGDNRWDSWSKGNSAVSVTGTAHSSYSTFNIAAMTADDIAEYFPNYYNGQISLYYNLSGFSEAVQLSFAIDAEDFYNQGVNYLCVALGYYSAEENLNYFAKSRLQLITLSVATKFITFDVPASVVSSYDGLRVRIGFNGYCGITSDLEAGKIYVGSGYISSTRFAPESRGLQLASTDNPDFDAYEFRCTELDGFESMPAGSSVMYWGDASDNDYDLTVAAYAQRSEPRWETTDESDVVTLEE